MMNKTVLMLSVSCMSFIAGADLCYASFNPYDTPPALSAAMLNSRNSTHTSHLTAAHLSSLEDFAEFTLPENSDLFLPKALGSSLSYPLPKDLGRGWGGFHNTPLIQLAAACFVTDTTNCSGNEFAGNNADEDDGGVPPGGPGDDYELDDEKRCEEEGYLLTSCPEGMKPYNFCPYDNTYFEKCVEACPSDYVTCEEPYHGVGEACDGKYASCECTPCGAGYDYTTIPEGYIQDGEACLDCDGKTKYKIKPNPCDGYMDCGDMGPEIGAGTCQSGNETLYDNCKACPYECALSSCPDNYTCTKEECSGMYCKSGCQSGYDWDAATQSCTEQCAYKCTLDSCPSGFVCEKEECSGKYCKIGCAVSSNWYSESTGECCASAYQYDEANCPFDSNYHCSTNTCGGKYADCKELPFPRSEPKLVIGGITFASSEDLCPGGKGFARRGYSTLTRYQAPNYGDITFGECMDADKACAALSAKISTAKSGDVISVDQDMYCGNIELYASDEISINGNGHTLTFRKFQGPDLAVYWSDSSLHINNLNIVSETVVLTEDEKRSFLSCNYTTSAKFEHAIFETTPGVEGVGFYLEDSKVSIGNGTRGGGSLWTTGENTFILQRDANGSATVLDGGTLNVKLEGGRFSYVLQDDVTVNVIRDGAMANSEQYSFDGNNITVNKCSKSGGQDNSLLNWKDGVCRQVTVNENMGSYFTPQESNSTCGLDTYLNDVYDSSVCDKMNF